jgi:multicomponent Na+:H+ antiporter subunit D
MQFDVLFPVDLALILPVLMPVVFALAAAVIKVFDSAVRHFTSWRLVLVVLAMVGGSLIAIFAYPVLMPPFVLLIVASLLILATSRKRPLTKVPDAFAIIGFAFTLLYVVQLALQIWPSSIVTYTWVDGPPLGSVLVGDMFSVLLMGLFSFMGLIVAIYSVGYMSHDTGLTRYYALLLVMVAAMNGVVVSGDLFTLFLFYETMGLCSFILVAFRRTWEGIEAAIKYLMMSAIGSTLVLYASSFLYGITGSLNLAVMAEALATGGGEPMLPVIVAMLTAGFGVKGAVVPFAAWLADAHPAAPSGISAMLSGVVIKVGIYGIVRVNTVLFPVDLMAFDWTLLIAVFAMVTMTAGNFWALTQKDLKRMLAYSSITQIGFILFAFGTGTLFGYQTGTFYIVVHALTKGLLFLCAGAFLHTVGTRDLDALQGIGKRMPITGAFFAIGVLSLMGMPPFAGFYSKLLILFAGVDAGGIYIIFTLVAVFNALLALGYYLRMITTVWMRPPTETALTAHRASPSLLLAMGILVLAIIFIGIFPGPVYSLAEAAGSALYNFGGFVHAILNAGSP